MSELTEDQESAGKTVSEAIDYLTNAWSDGTPAVVTDYVVLYSATYFNEDGEAVERFVLHWPSDGRTSYTDGLGLLERGKHTILRMIDEACDG